MKGQGVRPRGGGGALLYKTLLSTPPPQCGGYCLAKLMTGGANLKI